MLETELDIQLENMERELTWEERINLLSEDQRRGKIPVKMVYIKGDYSCIPPVTDKIIYYFCDLHGVPRIIKKESEKL